MVEVFLIQINLFIQAKNTRQYKVSTRALTWVEFDVRGARLWVDGARVLAILPEHREQDEEDGLQHHRERGELYPPETRAHGCLTVSPRTSKQSLNYDVKTPHLYLEL